MKYIVYFFFLGLFTTQAQTDYNTKKNFVAEGYDVVSYFENKAEVGHKDFTTIYDDAKFKFVSQAHLDTFIANPKQYIPQYGGYCAYAVAEKGKKVSIDPETFEIRNEKLYLFYNSWGTNTLELWLEKDVQALIKKADQSWKTISKKE
ncbi:YHS domain-containing (seleno)protein [Lacinutrix jangbogonensis]|uniref:YHS domain-containing (seleno)protein n=1 Tax=Lacinutrix jangbogonensis TaxID=1469557 RepID=UPI00053D4839|nr:YHS domain-containing (seleno)protein [Lacinutrix jangbogonensis]